MSQTYTDIFDVLQVIEQELKRMEQWLDTIPTVRAELYRSMVLPGAEEFQPIDMGDGTVGMFPGNQSVNVFRGQSEDYDSCCASMYRNDLGEIDIFIARVQQIEFELVLKKHPAVQDIASGPIRISFLGLAQHYGIRTQYLDVTSDPYVAAFFAVCKWSESERRFTPIRRQAKPGVLMKVPQLVYLPPMADRLEPIGLQPFPRPTAQKALAVRLPEGEEFRAHKMKFRHNQRSSERIYERFEGGQSLLPADAIESKALQIKSTPESHNPKIYSREAFEQVLARYDFTREPEFYLHQLRDHNIVIFGTSPYDFSKSQIDQFRQDWESSGRAEFYAQIGPTRLQYS